MKKDLHGFENSTLCFLLSTICHTSTRISREETMVQSNFGWKLFKLDLKTNTVNKYLANIFCYMTMVISEALQNTPTINSHNVQ